MADKHTRGVVLALVGGTGWGFSGACSQYFFAQGVDPLWASVPATAYAVFWLHTSFAPMDFVGFALIMATVFLLARFDMQEPSAKSPERGSIDAV